MSVKSKSKMVFINRSVQKGSSGSNVMDGWFMNN